MNSSREYNGEPLDMSWNTPPWANDGETVEASDDNRETGKMTTTDWPEAATPKEELTDKQQRIIKTAVKYPYLEYAGDLYEQSNLDEYVSRAYVAPVLTDHWREWFGKRASDGGGKVQFGEDNGASKLTEQDVIEIRKRAGGGESRRGISKDYPVSNAAIHKVIAGDTWPHVGSYNSTSGASKNEQSELTDLKANGTGEQPDTPTKPETPSTTPETPEKTRDYTKLAAVIVVAYHFIKTLWSLVSRSDN